MPAFADPPATQAGATVAHQALELRLPPVTHDQALARIAAAGSEAPLFWSPLIDGEALRLELTLPAGADPKRVRLALPAVSHVARLPSEPPAEAAGTTEATDPACHADWDHQSRATTLLLYNHPEGATGACTGTLVADDDPATDMPYVRRSIASAIRGARPQWRATGCCAPRPAPEQWSPATTPQAVPTCTT
jgi:hypothetical protein